jgi:hypothetical protein
MLEIGHQVILHVACARHSIEMHHIGKSAKILSVYSEPSTLEPTTRRPVHAETVPNPNHSNMKSKGQAEGQSPASRPRKLQTPCRHGPTDIRLMLSRSMQV